ncbi:TetR family transcriptional regulator [Luteibacter pinisoli]|uniref:TetR family transcriptional regulator n=1 Tax=Luteibacter pinisoli TaxID=2589080 RepID=A0A4Y5Z4I2_9GAMM|nr:TetR/AcrR family transcriptional regulator [Luteibacter pinisoli]QDE39836.1 TetR family transcriptional regulator [Luteibacter pinisoli]
MARPNLRDRILEAGFSEVGQRGYNATSVADIATAARVPKGSFYNHFASKEALGAAVVASFRNGPPPMALIRDPSLGGLARLRAYFEGLNRFFEDAYLDTGCLIGNLTAELAGHSEVIRAELQRVWDHWTDEIEHAVKDGQEAGDINASIDAATLAAFLLDAYEGSILRAKVAHDTRSLSRFMDITFHTLLRPV